MLQKNICNIISWFFRLKDSIIYSINTTYYKYMELNENFLLQWRLYYEIFLLLTSARSSNNLIQLGRHKYGRNSIILCLVLFSLKNCY